MGNEWQTLHNPFLYNDSDDAMMAHVSGRSTDIREIISGSQSALILSGAPCIGKTTLLRYLMSAPNAEWSWRQENGLLLLRDQFKLNQFHFVLIDLAQLEGIENIHELLPLFVIQCITALSAVSQLVPPAADLKGLRKLLRSLNVENPTARYFVMLDKIERLARPDRPFVIAESVAQTPQEQGIALLNHCGAIRTLVDLIDEFSNFGVILSIESLPRPKPADQFTHVSADLARFSTMTLQIFTWDDTTAFLRQEPEDFGNPWSHKFQKAGGNTIFSEDEQVWIREQAGTHPYLLQQFCFYAFHFKQGYASVYRIWKQLEDVEKQQLTELVKERVSTFLRHLWKRLQEALNAASIETKDEFYNFIRSFEGKKTEVLSPENWKPLSTELRYILSSEGIVRSDLFQDVYYPGAILRDYLQQRAYEEGHSITRSFWIVITKDGRHEPLSLSELEYRLVRTLMHHPKRCAEDELMKGAWGQLTERPKFTQRMHHLRKKLRDHCDGVEVIVNHYGGHYSLSHPDWLQLE
ncbi:MAG: winged helix-turn-helix domain-containing protein [Chloroflexi bacterium]|nr:winged helix-turn-helix domain-containing protein [Chloroflexota bacterium]